MDFSSLYLVNQSYTILLRKHVAAEEISDRPISLLHNFCKLVTKVLVTRVSPFMPQLVQLN
jgi:hypothetical protein